MSPEKPPPPAPEKRPALDAYYRDWEKRAAEMKEKSAAFDWSKVDFAKIKPGDISMHMGPMLSEDQFRQYQARRQAEAQKTQKKFSH